MPIRSFLLTEYFTFLLKRYDVFRKKQEDQEIFRIISIRDNLWDECLFKIQVVGKATVFDCAPQEIAGNDNFLESFSKKDIRTIVYFATQEIKKPRYRLLTQDVQENLKKIVFKLSQYGSPQFIEKTAEQISLDKALLRQLSQEDAHVVGYTVATEQIIREKSEMEALKKKV